jgi:hypothetical protein
VSRRAAALPPRRAAAVPCAVPCAAALSAFRARIRSSLLHSAAAMSEAEAARKEERDLRAEDEENEDLFADYQPLHFQVCADRARRRAQSTDGGARAHPHAPPAACSQGGQPHPDPVVETTSLSFAALPPITYQLKLPDSIYQPKGPSNQFGGALSRAQLETVSYASQRFEVQAAAPIPRRHSAEQDPTTHAPSPVPPHRAPPHLHPMPQPRAPPSRARRHPRRPLRAWRRPTRLTAARMRARARADRRCCTRAAARTASSLRARASFLATASAWARVASAWARDRLRGAHVAAERMRAPARVLSRVRAR